eukprot:sb/3469071/
MKSLGRLHHHIPAQINLFKVVLKSLKYTVHNERDKFISILWNMKQKKQIEPKPYQIDSNHAQRRKSTRDDFWFGLGTIHYYGLTARLYTRAALCINTPQLQIDTLISGDFPDGRACGRVCRRLHFWELQKWRPEDTKHVAKHIKRLITETNGGLVPNRTGYRAMGNKLRVVKDVRVPQNAVRIALKEVDPTGVSARMIGKGKQKAKGKFVSPGPNFCWSADGHDKLAGLFGARFDIHIYG